jgi:hypothetical protein
MRQRNPFMIVLAAVSSLAALALSGCAAEPEAEDRSGPHLFVSPASTHDEIVKAARVTCEIEDADSCPAHTGMLIIENKAQCTAWLADERTLITNSHCIPDRLRKTGSACEGQLSVVFPKSGEHPEEIADCETVLSASDIPGKDQDGYMQQPDYAALRLTRSLSRPALRISRQGLPDGLHLKIFAVDPVSTEGAAGLLKAKSCTAVQGSMVVPGFTHSQAPVGVFSGCEITRGNSGSAAVDGDGAARAVAFGVITGAAIRQQSKGWSYKNRDFNTLAIMANAACLQLPEHLGLAGADPKACQATLATSAEKAARAELAATSDLEFAFQSWMRTFSPTSLVFSLGDVNSERTSSGSALKAPQVECILGSEARAKDPNVRMQTRLDDNSPLKRQVVIRYLAPVWRMDVDLDANLRLALKPALHKEMEFQIEFDPDLLERSGRTEALVRVGAKGAIRPANAGKMDLYACITPLSAERR